MSDDLDRKAVLFSHLLNDHDVLLTTKEFFDTSLDDLRALDPCEAVTE